MYNGMTLYRYIVGRSESEIYMCIYTCTCTCLHIYKCIQHDYKHTSTCVYGNGTCTCSYIVLYIRCFDKLAPLDQRASYLALLSSLFGPDGTVNYDYIVTNSITCNSLLLGSRCIPNGSNTNHC